MGHRKEDGERANQIDAGTFLDDFLMFFPNENFENSRDPEVKNLRVRWLPRLIQYITEHLDGLIGQEIEFDLWDSTGCFKDTVKISFFNKNNRQVIAIESNFFSNNARNIMHHPLIQYDSIHHFEYQDFGGAPYCTEITSRPKSKKNPLVQPDVVPAELAELVGVQSVKKRDRKPGSKNLASVFGIRRIEQLEQLRDAV